MLTKRERGKLCVVVGTRLTLDQYEALQAAYPDQRDSEALRNLVDDLRAGNLDALNREIERLEQEVQRAHARRRDAEDHHKEAQLQEEERERAAAAEQEAERVRARWLREHGSDITKWVSSQGARGDPVAYIESLGPPDVVARDHATEIVRRALARRQEKQR